VPESPVRAPGRIDWPGAGLLSVWLVCLLLPISEAPKWGWTAPLTLALFVAAVLVALAWIEVERRSPSPLVDMEMMRRRPVWTTNLVGVLVGWGMFGAFVLIPQFVQAPVSTGYGFGSSVTQAGLFLIPSALAMVLGGPLSGRLSLRVGSKPPLVAGVVLTIVSYAILVFAHSAHWQIYLSSLVMGIGVGFVFASQANLIVAAVRPDQTGVATGMNAVARTIGGAVGGQVSATILASTLLASGLPAERGYTISFLVSGGVMAVAFVVALAVPGRAPRRAQVLAPEPTLSVE
jgi:predicted MFS family arabinose efflux permease